MEKKKGISGSTLKLIAIACMLTDHIGMAIVERILINRGMGTVINEALTNCTLGNLEAAGGVFADWGSANITLFIIYFVMRMIIGRIAFPIFCFTLVEGFAHTHNRIKYAVTMLIFAVITEIPFNLAVDGSFWSFAHQNVMWTLLLGILTMWIIEMADDMMEGKVNRFVHVLVDILCILPGAFAAQILNTDYGYIGIVAIAIIYLVRKSNVAKTAWSCLALTLFSFTEAATFFCLIPIGMYNGQRGLKMKYFFYIFYPAHLLILYLIAKFMQLV